MQGLKLSVRFSIVVIVLMIVSPIVYAQKDTTKPVGIDQFLKNRKGVIGTLSKNLVTDTTETGETAVRNELLFVFQEGKVIRRVDIKTVDFGTPINDTTRRFQSALIRLANTFHRDTRNYVIRNNLFFKPGDTVSAPLMSDNERHLRDQPYLQDAKIIIRPVRGSEDSVDVTVLTKDVLTLGGTFHMRNTTAVDVSIKEENIGGWGDKFSISGLYDNRRRNPVGYGAEFIKRNIAGSFIDGYAGYKTFTKTFNTGRSEEINAYASFIRPLVNPYMKFTYATEIAYHASQNLYASDSLYNKELKYRYYNYDAWLGWNTGAFSLRGLKKTTRLRTLVALRYLKKDFDIVPENFESVYNFMFANISGVLASLSVFQQNSYKTRYIYGFGRNEDVPEGVDMSLTTGWIKKQGIQRPYLGLDFQRYYFTEGSHYFIYTARAGGYWREKRFEDVNLLFNLDYFSRLRTMSPKWKQRTFISAGITGQLRKFLNEPLFLESQFGLPEWRNLNTIGGDVRTTVKAESVFYSPIHLINFRFAPFIFANTCLLTPTKARVIDSKFYNSLGAGIRTRNESLIFGTIELKVFYFPQKNFFGDNWRIETNTNVRFKYNRQFIKRPEFIVVN